MTRAFYLGVFEVTQQQYLQVIGTNPSSFVTGEEDSESISGTFASRRPVDNVSWLDAVGFCSKLSELEERKPCYAIGEEDVTVVEGTAMSPRTNVGGIMKLPSVLAVRLED